MTSQILPDPISKSPMMERPTSAGEVELADVGASEPPPNGSSAMKASETLGKAAAPSPAARRASPMREAARAATFLEVATEELSRQMQHDGQSAVLVERRLIDSFLSSPCYSEQLHLLPDPSQQEEAARTLAWCARLVQDGRRPVVVLTESCLQRLFGQLCQSLRLRSLPMRFIVVQEQPPQAAGEVDAAMPRGTSVLAFLRLLPQTVIISPKDGWELRQMLRFAAAHCGPIAVQIPFGPLPALEFPDFVEELEFGKAEVLEEGDEVVLLAFGPLAAPAVKAASELSRQGISAGVVNARFAEPLDRQLICGMAGRVKGLMTLERGSAGGGFGTAVLELLADAGVATPVTVSGAVDIETSGESEADLVARIVRQAVTLVDRAGGTALPASRPARQPRPAGARQGINLFGFSVESLQREQDLVNARRLSPEVEKWYSLYSLAGERKRFLWQWCEQGAELTTLPCVSEEFFQHVCRTKVLSIMLCVLLDDVADQRNRETFLEAL